MAADASSGQTTEIDYINGYIVSLAERLNIPTPHHEMVREMVKFTSEVTGLLAETGPGRYALRVADRQDHLDRGVLNMSKERRASRGEKIRKSEEKRLEEKASDKREKLRAQRRGKKARRRERESAGGSLDQGIESTRTPDVTSTEAKDESAVGSGAVHEDHRRSTASDLAHLRESVQSSSRTIPQSELNPPHEADAAMVNNENEAEEQDEAIKAIESRIFSRSGRRGF